MLQATTENVLGNFHNRTAQFADRTVVFSTADERFYIEENFTGDTTKRYQVKYTFGYYPLQQYLIETDNGRLQAFDIAWDSREKRAGGQRWFLLSAPNNIDKEHPFFWTGYYQNWNSRCASCHSTNVQKNYNLDNNRFNTTFSEINVACESCHGPGQNHIQAIEQDDLSQAKSALTKTVRAATFYFTKNQSIATSITENNTSLDTCGGCHSRRLQISKSNETAAFHQNYLLDSIESPQYHLDGQVNEEAFEFGSFLQSKMAKAGVTCINCHDPHSGALISEAENICLSCHQATVFASPTHLNGHKKEDCLACHMPETTFMKIDQRRDHRFNRPNTLHPNSSSACRDCHKEKDDQWIKTALRQWPKRAQASKDTLGDWAKLNGALANLDVNAVDPAIEMILKQEVPILARGALAKRLSSMAPEKSLSAIHSLANSNDPLAKVEAIRALRAMPLEIQRPLLLTLADDPYRSVRMEVALSIVQIPSLILAKEAPRTTRLLKEWENVLLSNADHPDTNVQLALLALYKRDYKKAKNFFEQAIALDKTNSMHHLQYAEFLRHIGDAESELAHLKLALYYSPNSAIANYSIGLNAIRNKNYTESLHYLRNAAFAENSLPRYNYVYAALLWQLNQRKSALSALQESITRWESSYELLIALAEYAIALEDKNVAADAIDRLKQYYGTPPQIKMLEKKLRTLSQGVR